MFVDTHSVVGMGRGVSVYVTLYSITHTSIPSISGKIDLCLPINIIQVWPSSSGCTVCMEILRTSISDKVCVLDLVQLEDNIEVILYF